MPARTTTISRYRSITSTSKRSTIWPESSPITRALIHVACSQKVGWPQLAAIETP
jgi:hypothetical protein